MGIEGIGARVARKEDKRFITGAGRYVEDMVVPGMKHATFVPQSVRTCRNQEDRRQASEGDAGCRRRADRQGTEGRRHRQSDLRLDDPFQGRLADEDGAWSPLAVDRVRYVGDAVVIVVADTKGQARDAAEAVEITYKELPSVTDASKAMGRASRRSIRKRLII